MARRENHHWYSGRDDKRETGLPTGHDRSKEKSNHWPLPKHGQECLVELGDKSADAIAAEAHVDDIAGAFATFDNACFSVSHDFPQAELFPGFHKTRSIIGNHKALNGKAPYEHAAKA